MTRTTHTAMLWRALVIGMVVVLLSAPSAADADHAPATGTTSGYFADDDTSPHEQNIETLAAAGITVGCAIGTYCPDGSVTRGQMAAFVTRAFDLPAATRDWFVDDDGSIFQDAIDRMRTAKLTSGCNPPANDRYCPDAPVTRAQMATFLVRARGLQPLQGVSDRIHPVALNWHGLQLRTISSGTELIGLHQSNHEGARDLSATDAVPTLVMESRGRGTGLRTAADIVAHPEVEIRAPVSGTVERSGTYTLYCRYSDDYLVIEPDGLPGFEVKLLHIDGVRDFAHGDRVEAGVTVVARRPTVLPFASQVDDHSDASDWPHVHVELVDTSIPNEPSPGGGC